MSTFSPRVGPGYLTVPQAEGELVLNYAWPVSEVRGLRRLGFRDVRVHSGKNSPRVIAHRLSTILHADKIVVLSEGRIESVGRHESLLVSSPTYARLYRLQFERDL